jgi:N-methylhydantoinase A
MGGTTAKACLIDHGEPELTNTFEVARVYRFKKGSGFPVSVPSVDLVEIGAGGGSLAHVDQFGLLKVGSRIRRRRTRPASYGRGGTEPAVTDADVVLGLLDPARSSAATCHSTPTWHSRRCVSARSSTCPRSTSRRASTRSSTRTWRPPHGCTPSSRASTCAACPCSPSVGAGPVHACGVAELLESDRVIFPVNASVLSAFGTLVSPVRIDLARSMPRRSTPIDAAERDALLDELRDEGRRVLAAAGVPDARRVPLRHRRPLRRPGQRDHHLGRRGRHLARRRRQRARCVRGEYRRIYGLTIPDVAIEASPGACRRRRRRHRRARPARRAAAPNAVGPAAPSCSPGRCSRGRHPVYRRAELGAGATSTGPAVVEERETTAVIRPGWSVEVAPTAASSPPAGAHQQ